MIAQIIEDLLLSIKITYACPNFFRNIDNLSDVSRNEMALEPAEEGVFKMLLDKRRDGRDVQHS